MKSIVLSSVVTALLIFSGCSSKNPDATGTNATTNASTNAQEVEGVNTETVPAANSLISSGNTGIDSMSVMEGKLGSVYFEFDQFTVTPAMQSKVTNDSDAAKTAVSKYNIKLEGNCDEWGSDEYNFALGLKRADSVKKALIANGVDASKITMVSYGESNPSCSDKTQECWANNRRVDFKLLP
ncbi:MAG: peptidoglycan-associated lipoprotein [Sulfurimonas sp.]|jgi:peptidoglycan-associated lipoprotein|uniref:OmpA family protein n=1 Tax=Sulfurimonas sp. TaxID=2022749 RepID=UPI0039E61B7A